jgi:uncharacterized glyoxalase superfamily protein PhnB
MITGMRNRSVPSDSVVPHIVYQDPVEACAWLSRVFGFRENFRYGDPVSGVQVLFGEVCVMLHRANPGTLSPSQLGYGTQSLTLIVDDVDAHYARTVAEGATIVEELHETIYGEQQYGVEDLAGHLWIFSQHARDADPAEWGATVRE